jgi:hypothetical protein
MGKLSWHQNIQAKLKTLTYRHLLVYVGGTILYLTIIAMVIFLPFKFVQSLGEKGTEREANITNSNNYLPSYCPAYTNTANGDGLPLSDGPLKLPFQRPQESCRTFTSEAMETLIANVTSRMVDKDLARLFENTYPNTLGLSSSKLGSL